MNLGQVYTKRAIADFMVGLFSLPRGARVLDPCFGRGVFVESLCANTDFRIDGIEIDKQTFPLFVNPAPERCWLKNCDFFDVEDTYDGIIMNPPYVRHEEIDKMGPLGITKLKLQSACGLMAISSKANLYMYFILRAILLLRKGGELVAIFPNSWTNTPVGRQFLELLRLHGCLQLFIDVEGEPFDASPMVDVCIIKYIKGIQDATHYQTMRINDDDTYTITDQDKQQERTSQHLIRLQSIARIRRGITTGANKLFVNPPLFTPDHQVDILSSPKDLFGFTTKHCRQDRMLAVHPGDTLNEEEKAYIENCTRLIKKEGTPQTLKKLIDSGLPWHYVTVPPCAQIIFSYIIRKNIKFVLNSKRCNVRDNFYMISSPHDPMLLMALLNNYHVFNQLESHGKSYGKGLLKLQKYDIDDIKMPHPSQLSPNDKARLIALSEELVRTDDTTLLDAITTTLAAYYGEPTSAKEQYMEQKRKRLAHHE